MVAYFLSRKLLLLFLLCLFALTPITSFADVKLKVDTLNINIEEAFEISIVSNNAISGDIDTSALTQDFEIIDQYKQSSVNIINGHVTQSSTWIYTVVAKRAGKITIPAITVGNESTQAIDITVKDSADTTNTQDIILEVEIEQPATYVQGQFIYVQKLLSAKPFRNNSTLTRPRLTKGRADIEPLGNTPERVVQRNGQDYRMLTRRFAVIPQESGKLVLAPSVFSGTLRRESQRNLNTFNYSSRSKRIRVKSKEIILNIKPRPDEFTGKDWIIAKDFSLHLNWPIPPDQLKAGDPITLGLTAVADGLRAEQLPDINIQAPDGIKLYPEKAIFDNIKNLSGIIGTMNKNIVLIATGGGEFILPKISIPWWNSQTEKQEIATIESVKLKISGAPAVAPIQKAVTSPSPETNKTEADNEPVKPTLSNTLITLMVLAGLLLLLLFAWLYKNWQQRSLVGGTAPRKIKKHTAEDQQQILQKLKQACTDNKTQEAKKLFYQWAQNTEDKALTNPALQHAINDLNHALYSKESRIWQGASLWQAVNNYQTQHADKLKNMKVNHKNELESLYL